ncbi:NADH dehydrogenase (ubiquinone) complex I, assembly factor 6 isoform X2 [Ischnura elegans]|uniref:NADH dehydrogenase (ubiquinone) complex I, assembly factor 6 isoform X2 n=1 Tax=Ischnura elegans TaxID=197161 RepID=UPI001ED87EDA|nr:NADH dehydrogenase (ubiquinone) complex I, assembly factor 6 isoform X2 [Ischnura elegans]XP_046385213.1 NADH dehydrogenase (ubiquinone) complex I, assembly factor 6 isoform X2 [Ischnura elegans]
MLVSSLKQPVSLPNIVWILCEFFIYRQTDHEAFLCTLLLPDNVRTIAFAVRAFNSEVARVGDVASNSTIAQMRLTFWKESVDKIYSDCPPEHPIAKEIHRALSKHKLSKPYFSRLVTSRISQNTTRGFPTIEAMEKYAENSVSPVFYLILQAAGVQDVNIDHAASHLGKAIGITNSLRSVPFIVSKSNPDLLPIPVSTLVSHNVSTEAILRGGNDSFKDVTFEIASQAKLHLDKAKSLSKKLPRSKFPIFLPIVPVSGFLKRLQKANFNLFDPTLRLRDNYLPLKLYWAKVWSTC